MMAAWRPHLLLFGLPHVPDTEHTTQVDELPLAQA